MTPCFIAVTLVGMLASGKPAKDARAYLFIGPCKRISPVISALGERLHARSEITIGPIVTFARETPEEVVRALCVERQTPLGGSFRSYELFAETVRATLRTIARTLRRS
jgi:hypothetical protein